MDDRYHDDESEAKVPLGRLKTLYEADSMHLAVHTGSIGVRNDYYFCADAGARQQRQEVNARRLARRPFAAAAQ